MNSAWSAIWPRWRSLGESNIVTVESAPVEEFRASSVATVESVKGQEERSVARKSMRPVAKIGARCKILLAPYNLYSNCFNFDLTLKKFILLSPP